MEYALGVEPRESDYKLIEQGQITGNKEGALGTLDFRKLPLPSGPAPKNRRERDRYSVTIRLHVVDDQGLTAEARRSFFVFRDPTWKGGAPLQLGASGEAAPVLADLDGDGREEIVLPTADGYLRIFKWESGGLKALLAPLDRMPALDPSTRIQDTARPDLEVRESVIRSAAVGDLNGDGRQKVVVASREGKVYVFDANGARVAPFPVSLQRERARPATPDRVVESGILSRPVLADLDGKPGLEIIVAALDGSVYAWHANGRLVDGFPVSLETPSEGAGRAAKIISTPAVGDIDGDGVPEIVVGSNTIRDGLGAVYAIRADGLAHPGGAFVPGWRPFEIAALRPELLPTIATGIPMDPILTDVDGDGDQEVVLYAVTANTILLVDQTKAGAPRILARYGMDPGRESGILGTSFLTGAGSPLLADTDGDGEAELYAPLLPFRMLTMRLKPAVPIEVPLGVGGWKLRERAGAGGRTPMLPDYPRPIEDLALLASPIAADVDGDGVKEILMGSGGYLLHAFKAGGGEADGFPKFTGGWIFSEPAVGDLDGDKLPELVTVTREGYLFVWDLARSAGGDQAARRAPVRSAPGRSRDSRRPR
jgi:hypothetical protein